MEGLTNCFEMKNKVMNFLINSISKTTSNKIKEKYLVHLYYVNKNMCKIK